MSPSIITPNFALPSILTNSSRSFRKIEVYPRIHLVPLFQHSSSFSTFSTFRYRLEGRSVTPLFSLFQSLFYRYLSPIVVDVFTLKSSLEYILFSRSHLVLDEGHPETICTKRGNQKRKEK